MGNIMANLDRTYFIYCRYLRELDLNDLGQLFEADKFRTKIEKKFFEGELSKLRILSNTARPNTERLDINAVTNRVGDVVTEKAPLLEAISSNSGLDSSSALRKWIPMLSKLQELKLFNGKTLADPAIPELITAHCPFFRRLWIFLWVTPESDHQLATFIQGIPTPTLHSLQIFSANGIGAESFLGLNHHAPTLKLLRLSAKPAHLALLSSCTQIETLILEDPTGTSDLEHDDPSAFATIASWLQSCHYLRVLEFNKFPPAAALITPALLSPAPDNSNNSDDTRALPHLHRLQVEGYAMRHASARAFHEALAHQRGLRTLVLKGDAEGSGRADCDALCEAVGAIGGLRDLKLRGVSEFFANEHVSYLAGNLPELEHLYVEGWAIGDGVWGALGGLRKLQWISFMGLTQFTREGLMGFVRRLRRPGNEGIVVMVDNADLEGRLSEEEQAEVREAILERVDGRFEYTLYRGRLTRNANFLQDQADFRRSRLIGVRG
ncbi:MAG: hypothetical protein Q9157_007362 [Trypethelium eluteriae]